MKRLLASLTLILVFLSSGAVMAQQQAMLDRAFATARQTFIAALPGMKASVFGVDIEAYGNALLNKRFTALDGVGEVRVRTETGDGAGSCSRFAAFVRIPAKDGAVTLVLCPQFFTPGAEDLRTLTILHEMVHVVAGPDECRAMALAALIEQRAFGRFTPVDGYWQASGCAGSRFSLP